MQTATIFVILFAAILPVSVKSRTTTTSKSNTIRSDTISTYQSNIQQWQAQAKMNDYLTIKHLGVITKHWHVQSRTENYMLKTTVIPSKIHTSQVYAISRFLDSVQFSCENELKHLIEISGNKWEYKKPISTAQIKLMCILYKYMSDHGYGIIYPHFTVFGLVEYPEIDNVINTNNVFRQLGVPAYIEVDYKYFTFNGTYYEYKRMNVDVWRSEVTVNEFR